MGKTYLITGASGFIGGSMVRRLLQNGESVICLVRNRKRVLELEELGARTIEGSFTDDKVLTRAVSASDVIMHFAAIRGESRLPWEEYFNSNVEATRLVAEKACECGVSRFIFCSTEGVLGKVDQFPANENTPVKPDGKYHLSKAIAENHLNHLAKSRSLPVTIIRPVVTYGPGDTGMISKLTRFLSSGILLVPGRGKNLMHLVYIENLLDGFLAAVSTDSAVGKTYFIGDKEILNLGEIVGLIANTLRISPKVVHMPERLLLLVGVTGELMGPTLSRFGLADAALTRSNVRVLSQSRAYDISKAIRELGYRPKHSTWDAIPETVRLWQECR